MQALQQLELLQTGDLQLALSIRPSTSWDVADVERVGSIIQRRNQFVCMQLVTMVKEQFSKVSAAVAAGDLPAVHAASYTFLATLESVDCGSVLAAGLFYPRACSKGGSGMPHMYVELICCNSPGKGLGSCLLQHIEDFVAANCEAISAGVHGSPGLAAGQAVGDAGGSPAAALLVENFKTGISHCGAGALSQQQQQPLGRQRRSVSHLPVVLPDAVSTHAGMTGSSALAIPGTLRSLAGSSLSASNSSISSLASYASSSTCSNFSTESGVLAPSSMGSCASLQEAALHTRAPPLSSNLNGASGSTAGAADKSSSSSQAPPPASDALPTNNSSGSNNSCNKIQGIKLLSVQSAEGFYTKCGYGAPDSCNEMFKPLSVMQQGLDAILARQQAV